MLGIDFELDGESLARLNGSRSAVHGEDGIGGGSWLRDGRNTSDRSGAGGGSYGGGGGGGRRGAQSFNIRNDTVSPASGHFGITGVVQMDVSIRLLVVSLRNTHIGINVADILACSDLGIDDLADFSLKCGVDIAWDLFTRCCD